jgi:hypothetical protein
MRVGTGCHFTSWHIASNSRRRSSWLSMMTRWCASGAMRAWASSGADMRSCAFYFPECLWGCDSHNSFAREWEVCIMTVRCHLPRVIRGDDNGRTYKVFSILIHAPQRAFSRVLFRVRLRVPRTELDLWNPQTNHYHYHRHGRPN